MPPLHSPEDYYGFKTKRNTDDQAELEAWHVRESRKYCTCEEYIPVVGFKHCYGCSHYPWDFQEQLKLYCWLDVDVLAEAVKKYREELMTPGADIVEGWQFPGLDPFQLLTQSQLAMSCFLNGFQNQAELSRLACTQYSVSEGNNDKSNIWMGEIGGDILYRGNSLKEYYCIEAQTYVTGFSQSQNTVYLFYDCKYEGCSQCHPLVMTPEILNDANKSITHQRKIDSRYKLQKLRTHRLETLSKYYTVETLWEHEFDQRFIETPPRKIMKDRDFFYGGRTEVFQSYSKPKPEEAIAYHDVCSLYPFVCANKEMPMGFPQIYFKDVEKERLHFSHPNAYWGFAYIRVLPNKQDLIGLLPSRDADSGRLQFTLYEQEGCWHTEEIYLAQQHGYQVLEVYQVYHWDPCKRSSTFMRGYVAYWLRQKQEADGWKKAGASSETPDEAEQLRVCETMFHANGDIGRMRPEFVRKNAEKRAMAKLMLNCLWGKFVQRKQPEYTLNINGYYQYLALVNNPEIDRGSMVFRHIQNDFFKVTVNKLQGHESVNKKYQIFIGASVTAHARCILHRQMLIISPERVLYCDTDSIIFKRIRAAEPLTGKGLGKWVDEYPNKEIVCFYALAPKCYNLVFDDGHNSLKTKGVTLTMENQLKVIIFKSWD